MALLSAQRQQTLHLFNVVDMKVDHKSYVFYVNNHLKHTRPGNFGMAITFRAYPPDRRLCVHNYITEYLRRTKICRKAETALFVSYKKPHGKVSKDTLARWLRTVMTDAGINTDQFKPHSVRSAAVSKASLKMVPVSDILAQAGWRRESTFRRFYCKPISKDSVSFANAVLAE